MSTRPTTAQEMMAQCAAWPVQRQGIARIPAGSTFASAVFANGLPGRSRHSLAAGAQPGSREYTGAKMALLRQRRRGGDLPGQKGVQPGMQYGRKDVVYNGEDPVVLTAINVLEGDPADPSQLPGKDPSSAAAAIHAETLPVEKELELRFWISDGTLELVELCDDHKGHAFKRSYFKRGEPFPGKKASLADVVANDVLVIHGAELQILGAKNESTRSRLAAEGFFLPIVKVGREAPETCSSHAKKQCHMETPAFVARATKIVIEKPTQNIRSLTKILRFDCEAPDWAEGSAYEEPSFDLEHLIGFTLLYFVEDGTVQVVEKRSEPNTGRSAFRCLLQRQILPDFSNAAFSTASGRTKYPILSDHISSDFNNAELVKQAGIITPEKLYIGATVDVYGKKLLLVDADPATRHFYSEVFQVKLGPHNRRCAMLEGLLDKRQESSFGRKVATSLPSLVKGKELALSEITSNCDGDGPGLAGERARLEFEHRRMIQSLRDHAREALIRPYGGMSASTLNVSSEGVTSSGSKTVLAPLLLPGDAQSGIEGLGYGCGAKTGILFACEDISLVPVPANRGRQFMLRYQLEDDTIEVVEVLKENSGHTPCRVAVKRRYASPEGIPYRLWHLEEGTLLRFGGKTIKLGKAEPESASWMTSWWEKRQLPIHKLKKVILSSKEPLASLAEITFAFRPVERRHLSMAAHMAKGRLYGHGYGAEIVVSDNLAMDLARRSGTAITYVNFISTVEKLVEGNTAAGAAGSSAMDVVELITALDPEGAGEIEYLSFCGLFAGKIITKYRDLIQKLWTLLGGSVGGVEYERNADGQPESMDALVVRNIHQRVWSPELYPPAQSGVCSASEVDVAAHIRSVLLNPLQSGGIVHYLDFFLHMCNVCATVENAEEWMYNLYRVLGC